MSARRFRTVPDELLHVAHAATSFMSDRGFRIRKEHQALGFPSCPTLYCKRGHTTCVVEVVASIDPVMMREWVSFGKSCGHDFQIAYVAPATPGFQTAIRDLLAKYGVGLLEVEDTVCVERLVSQDLSLNVQLPTLTSMPAKVRALVGVAYEHFHRGTWREGFGVAAQALEAEARRYLKRHAARLIFVGKPVKARQIDLMPLGALAKTFERIQNKNLSDQQIGATLDAINKDRIGVTHHRGRRDAEQRLRTNVGRHMWAICAAMKHVVK